MNWYCKVGLRIEMEEISFEWLNCIHLIFPSKENSTCYLCHLSANLKCLPSYDMEGHPSLEIFNQLSFNYFYIHASKLWSGGRL